MKRLVINCIFILIVYGGVERKFLNNSEVALPTPNTSEIYELCCDLKCEQR